MKDGRYPRHFAGCLVLAALFLLPGLLPSAYAASASGLYLADDTGDFPPATAGGVDGESDDDTSLADSLAHPFRGRKVHETEAAEQPSHPSRICYSQKARAPPLLR